MTNNISVNPEQLKIQARVYLDAREKVDQANKAVKMMNNQIASQWQGNAFKSYFMQYEQLNVHVNGFIHLLDNIHKQLTTYANTVDQRDKADAKSFGL